MSGGLPESTGATFARDGPLVRASASYVPRIEQLRMAEAIAETIESGGALVVEAGTGVGKTYAYLVPALLSGERVLVSTATKALQDQLFSRDLPRLTQALNLPARLALLKGRASYLCLHRMEHARHDPVADSRAVRTRLAAVERWSQVTRTGDLAELPDLDERSAVIPLVTSTRENCLGSACPKFHACHVNLARREALAADVVVVNHHLFFADIAVRESGMAELLPTVRCVIFDEAHQLNETGVQFLGSQFGTGQTIDLARDLLSTGLQHARGLADWHGAADALERATRDLRLAAGARRAPGRWRWSGVVPDDVDADEWSAAVDGVARALDAAAEALDTVSEIAPDFPRLHERARAARERLQRFQSPAPAHTVRWLDIGSQMRLVESPLDIAETVRRKMLRTDEVAARVDASAPQRAWIFTSATLGDDAKLTWFTEPCGLGDARVLRLGSPFDYETQAALYVPRSFPKPGEAAHSQAVAALASTVARRLGGRTLVLTTTLRALAAIGAAMREALRAASTDALAAVEVLVQGEQPKRLLIERFRAGGQWGGPRVALVASASFWEGIDVPGPALEAVVIDKLPFPPPGDPMVEARTRWLDSEGRSPFNDYFVPEAAVALKQGAGRLIRSETDRGVLVVCDPRLASMGYGRRLIAALPPMRRLADEKALEEALDDLAVTRTSTSDLHPT